MAKRYAIHICGGIPEAYAEPPLTPRDKYRLQRRLQRIEKHLESSRGHCDEHGVAGVDGPILNGPQRPWHPRRPLRGDEENVMESIDFEIYPAKNGEFWWRLKSSNGQIIGTSGEGYKNKSHCKEMVEKIKRCASGADVAEVDG